MEGIIWSPHVDPVEKKYLSGQDLYNELSKIRKIIKKEDLSSQFSKYFNKLNENRKISSSTKISLLFGQGGGKPGMGWDEVYMSGKLRKNGTTVGRLEYMVLSLEKELENPYSEFHKLAFNSLPKDTFNDEKWEYIEDNGDSVSVFGSIHTEIPLNKDIWDMYNNKDRIINLRYRQSFIGIHPKIKNKMPDNFYIRKVA